MSIIGAFIVPHPPLIMHEVGRGEEEKIYKTIKSYNEISDEILELNPDTIIISSPHAPMYSDGYYLSNCEYLDGNMSRFNAPEVSFHEEVDLDLVNKIKEIGNNMDFPVVTVPNIELDHGTMVPLYFIRKKLPKCKIIVLGISGLSLLNHYQMGQIIKEACDSINKKYVYVASGDLSHVLQEDGPYGFMEEGPIYDERIMNDCSRGDFYNLFNYSEELLDKAAPCGHWSFLMMAGALDGMEVIPKFYSHEDITGVGYGIISYKIKDFNSNRLFAEKYMNLHRTIKSDDPYIRLAQDTIENYIVRHKRLDINSITDSELLNNQAGVFVSIHEFNELRGCIGTFLPTKNTIGEEIISNAISAATKDYRFKPIKESELPYLDINVDVLSTPEKISSKDDLDPKKYGVIVTSGIKRGLLLPDLEGVDDVDTQISIAKSKAGIEDNEEISLMRFEVIRHKD